MRLERGSGYVALGSSFAAGPGVGTRVPGSPRRAGRSSTNYAHLVAGQLGLELTDVSFSGATTVDVLGNGLGGEPPQLEAVTAATALVTITVGGNDVRYLPLLIANSVPALVRRILFRSMPLSDLRDPATIDARFGELHASMSRLASEVRSRAPHATVLFVEYPAILPPDGTPAPPLPAETAAIGRDIAARLSTMTREVAAAAGCGVVPMATLSVDHHAWSDEPWTTTGRLGRGRAPYHPNQAGMSASANAVIEAVVAA